MTGVGLTATGVRLLTRNARLSPFGSVTRGKAIGADAEARQALRNASSVCSSSALIGGAPDHFAHGVAGFDRRRQIGGILWPHDHLGAVARPIDQLVGDMADTVTTPQSSRKRLASAMSATPKIDGVDALKRHDAVTP